MSGPSSRCTKLDRMVARMKEVLQCTVCLEIVGSPALQCEEGHLMCSSCRSNLQSNSCPTCRGSLLQTRIRAVEQVVKLLPKDCPYVSSGCQEILEEAELETHRVACPHRQFTCHRPPCPWVGYKPEVMGHMQESHPEHVFSSNSQTVKVPVKWDEVSSWTMFLNDEILLLKFRLDRATNMLFGSVMCPGLPNPVDTFKYHMSVKKGDQKMTTISCIGPERSPGDSQTDQQWDCVFPSNKFDQHSVSQLSSEERYVEVEVTLEDKRGGAVLQGAVDVPVETETRDDDDEAESHPPAGVGQDEASTSTSQQVHYENQLNQVAQDVCYELGDWISGYFREDILTQMNDVISDVTKKMSNISNSFHFLTYHSEDYLNVMIERFGLLHSLKTTEIDISIELIKAAGGRGFKTPWMYPIFHVLEQKLSEAFYKEGFFPAQVADRVRLNELTMARVRRLRVEAGQRTLRCAHGKGEGKVNEVIDYVGQRGMKSDQEISRLKSAAAKINWSNFEPIRL